MARALLAALLAVAGALIAPGRARADNDVALAAHVSLTGSGAFAARAYLEAAQMAVDEANAARGGPRFTLQVLDDAGTDAGARDAAAKVIASAAPVVLGPTLSPEAIVACPIYAKAGLPVIIATVHADELTANATTFRTVISTGEIGEALADYLGRVLHGTRAAVLSRDNGYGRPFAARFRAAADRLGIDATYATFADAGQRDAGAHALTQARDPGAVLLGMTYEDAVPVMTALRRDGYRGLIMGTATMARASYADLFASEPEEGVRRGFFTDGAYATSPMILDSANAEVLAFAERFAARTGHEPSWEAVQAYDGTALAISAVRAALAGGTATADTRALRAAVLAAIVAHDAPAHAMPGLNGPIWFSPDRIRAQAVRMGRFYGGLFESAPVLLVPVAHADAADLASGAVIGTSSGGAARLQRVVQTGTYVNAVSRLDLVKSSFEADFYLWLRYARAGGADVDPADIVFPNMVGGRFQAARPAESASLADGTEYRLWRVRGDFRNDFDLRRFPFDRQVLRVSFYNARASSDRVVYVLDRRGAPPVAADSPTTPGPPGAAAAATVAAVPAVAGRLLVSGDAFRELSQWHPLGARERRESLVTASTLGDLRRVGLGVPRELSGFLATIELERSAGSVLVKTLLPVLLMTVILYATLHFPVALTKEKVTVAVTAALSGAVFLAAVNGQLGGIGYTIAMEYALYLFFALCLLCVAYVMAFETLRTAGRAGVAVRLERAMRAVFMLSVLALAAAAFAMYRGWLA